MTADGAPRAQRPLSTLRHRSVLLYLVSRFFSGVGMTMFYASVAWQVYEISGSELALGVLGLVRFVPHLLLSLLGGALADSADRRRILMLALSVPMLASLVLYFVTTEGTVTLPILYALIFTIGVAAAFHNPARWALLPTLLPRAEFPNAVTLNTTFQALGFVTGPALGGLLIGWSGVASTYALHSALIFVSIASLFGVHRHPEAEQGARREVSWTAIREGIEFVRTRRAVLGAMSLDMFAVIFAGAQALLPVYATQILEVGPRGYGILAASLELGALAMAGILLLRPPIERTGRALCLAVAAYGLATIVFGLSRSFPLSVLAYMAVGMADQVSMVTRGTLIQLSTPDELRGRVSSVNMVFIGASNQLGAVESGFVAAFAGATFAVVSGGVGCLLALAAVTKWLPELREHRIDRAVDAG
jgi:MFS family permease